MLGQREEGDGGHGRLEDRDTGRPWLQGQAAARRAARARHEVVMMVELEEVAGWLIWKGLEVM